MEGHDSGRRAMTTPPLSVIVAARERWPALRACLDALEPQAVALGAEVVVAVTGADVQPPDAAARYPGVTWVAEPGGSVFSLRALALRHARGDVVAVTEDHAWVARDWCRRMLDAHTAHPDAVAIGGVVENAATAALVDWASFFVANGPFMAPIATGVTDAISLQANVSYKRRAVPGELPALGFMQMTFNRDLAGGGATLVADDRIVVHHMQALPWHEHVAAHFHNGRSIAAFRVARMARPMRALRALGCLVLPAVMLARTLRAVGRKRRHTRLLVASVPLMIALLCCHAAGELLGYLAGPADSPWHVR